mgnify:FL=1
MTLWYDEDENELVENRADLNVDVDGDEMRLDLSGSRKRELINVVEKLQDGGD